MTRLIITATIAVAIGLLSTAVGATAPRATVAGLLDDPPPPYPGWNGNPNG